MEAWSLSQLYKDAKSKLGSDRALELQKYARRLIHSGLPVIFSLKHLSRITGVEYRILDDTVKRKRESANYKMFRIGKRSGGWRYIHSVSNQLFSVQSFINKCILQQVSPYPASYAFHHNGGIKKCAAMHCGARWLFQYDLSGFFYDITEVDVFHIFEHLGYSRLLSLQLARICTTTHLPKNNRSNLGVLPQGAPTSPMLSNLAAKQLDERLSCFADQNGLVYTRYADDITLSAVDIPKITSVGEIHKNVIYIIRESGFKENKKKMRIAGPGSKKIVLGLLVDGDRPRISKETYRRIDRHLHAAEKYGIIATAEHEGFDSAYGFRNHLFGLITYVKDVDRERWASFIARWNDISPESESNKC